MDRDALMQVEEVVRLLASAANAARLYPRSSALPAEAVDRFVAESQRVTAARGALRLTVDPKGFRVNKIAVGSGQSQTVGLAEALHALQVGQLMLAPHISVAETWSFLDVVNADAQQVRRSGGARSALISADVKHLAVIEVTLRASDEEGILGLDLAAAPLEDIGCQTLEVAKVWASTASAGEGDDQMALAIDRLEEAAREVAQLRVAEALLRLDEHTRAAIVGAAYGQDRTGAKMQGMLGVIAKMQPAALARLLTIVAAQVGTEPTGLIAELGLPEQVFRELLAMVSGSPEEHAERGVPEGVDASALAAEATLEESTADLDRQIAVSLPLLASGRALETTVAVARAHPTEDAVAAIGEALPRAARDGAFKETHRALRTLEELSTDVLLGAAVSVAKSRLADPEVLADVVRSPLTDTDAAVVGEIVSAGGQAGIEVLLDTYARADAHARGLLRPVLRGMSEPVLAVASRLLRSSDTAASSVVLALPGLGDRRALTVLAQALDHIDVRVREAAVTGLAEMPGSEAREMLIGSVWHWDPQTAGYAARELGRGRVEEAVSTLTRQLEDINVFERKHELKKEVIRSLESIGSATALPALRRVARRRLAFGRKNRELRFLASHAVETLTEGSSSADTNQSRVRSAVEPGEDG